MLGKLENRQDGSLYADNLAINTAISSLKVAVRTLHIRHTSLKQNIGYDI